MLAAASAISIVAAGCGSDQTSSTAPATTPDTTPSTRPDTAPHTAPPASTGGDAIEYPHEADTAIVRLGGTGSAPELVIGGDGWVYEASGEAVGAPPAKPSGLVAEAPAAVPAPPAPTPFVRRQLTVEGVQIVLGLADDEHLLQDQEYESPGITDLSTTEVTVTVAGGSFVHDAYALGFEDETGNRKELLDFVNAIGDLEALVGSDNIGPIETYVPATFLVSLDGAYQTPGQVVDWPTDVPVVEGCVELPVDHFDDGVAGLYIARIDGHETRVAVLPDLPGDECT